MPYDAETLKRIKDIIGNARATWFALLGALVFAAITLASVKDVAFFVDTVETKLPIVGFSVPVRSFFWAGALLIAALYAYFHLYLELLWQALGDAPARVAYKPADGGPMRTAPLADYIEPWIVADAALRRRDKLRGVENDDARAARQRMMPWVGYLVFFGLVWLFGLVVIGWFWWRSMPAHEPLLTGWLALVYAFTLWVYFKSRHSARDHLRNTKTKERWRIWFPVVFAAIAGLTVVRTSWDPWAGVGRDRPFTLFMCDQIQTASGFKYCPNNFLRIAKELLRPASANLREVVFTDKPKDWQGKAIMEAEFRLRWCKEHKAFAEVDCGTALAVGSNGEGGGEPFAGINEKEFQKAWNARWKAQIASFPKPDLHARDLRGADLSFAVMEGADLFGAGLEGANLWRASLEFANLADASFEGANLKDASLAGANISFARLFGNSEKNLNLGAAHNLKAAYFQFAALRLADVSGVEMAAIEAWNESFGDGSVAIAYKNRPPSWCMAVLSDAEFFGRWRGYVDPADSSSWDSFFENYPAIPPSVPCPSKRRDE